MNDPHEDSLTCAKAPDNSESQPLGQHERERTLIHSSEERVGKPCQLLRIMRY